MSGCGLCPNGAGGPTELVGPALDAGVWTGGVLRGYEVPGWLALFPRRHVESADALSDAESGALGGTVRAMTGAIRASTSCAKVYTVSFGERLPHWHVLLMAVPVDLPDELRGAALIGGNDRLRDSAAARAAAQDIADRLGCG